MNVSLELVCFIVSRMTDTWECEESAMNRDRSLLQTVLDTINIILFPDLRPVDGDVDSSMISTDKELTSLISSTPSGLQCVAL